FRPPRPERGALPTVLHPELLLKVHLGSFATTKVAIFVQSSKKICTFVKFISEFDVILVWYTLITRRLHTISLLRFN
ncbi:MAG: hypothetical protein NC411_07320, partial [Bacteroides sp.]|nr:hypothetical protein [Bacteroides sp.]